LQIYRYCPCVKPFSIDTLHLTPDTKV